MIQHKNTYFIFGLTIGYIIGSIPFFMILVLFGVFYLLRSNSGVKLSFYSSYISPIENFIFKTFDFKSKENLPIRKLNVCIKAETLAEIEAYCRLKQESLDLFVEKAAAFVFIKDKDWIDYQRVMKKERKCLVTAKDSV